MKSSKIELTFEERALAFKRVMKRAEKKYGLRICAGYINSWDDSENLIIQEEIDNKIVNEVYLETLQKHL